MSANYEYDAVVAGHVCLDITPRFHDAKAREIAKLLVPGKLINVGNAALSTGGTVSNTGLGMARLGARVALMGKIGNDLFGTGIQAVFKAWGAAEALNIADDEETSYSVVIAPPGIDRIFLHHPGANDTFSSDDVNYELAAKARLFHFGYPPLMKQFYINDGSELIKMLSRVKRLGITTSLDMSLPDPQSDSGRVNWATILDKALPMIDIAPFSAEEVLFMLNRSRFDEIKQKQDCCDPMEAFTPDDFLWAGRELLSRGARIALVKCGSRGMLLCTAKRDRLAGMGPAAPRNLELWSNRELWEESFEVAKVVSTTGAGDSAIAGFLAGLLKGCGPEDSLAAAACTGAQNVRVMDAISGIHSWDETMAMIPGWQKRREQPGQDWTYDETIRVWHGPGDKA